MDEEAVSRHPLWGHSCPHRTLGESGTAAKAFSSSLPRQLPRGDQLELLAVLSPLTWTAPILLAAAQPIDPSNPPTGTLERVHSEQSREEIGLWLPPSPLGQVLSRRNQIGR